MPYRILEIDGLYYVEERSIWSLFIWQRWTRFGGSFGNEDIKFKSIEEAEVAIGKSKTGEQSKIIKWLR